MHDRRRRGLGPRGEGLCFTECVRAITRQLGKSIPKKENNMSGSSLQRRSAPSEKMAGCGCAPGWSGRPSFRFLLVLVFSLTLLVTGARAGDTILHNFTATPDGAKGADALVADSYGNLYGTTMSGGASGYGTVYVMCAPGAASPDILPCTPAAPFWTENVLYSFLGVPGNDGANPIGTLIFNGLYSSRAFTLYGTTYNGGVTASGSTCSLSPNTGCGTVFELCAPSSSGGCGTATAWTEKVLHAFAGGTDGAFPYAGVITDKGSDLFGTTVYGGNQGTCLVGTVNWRCGTAFKVKPNSSFTVWTETIMHRFKGGVDGANPFGALCCNTINAIANFYGTTLRGGSASSTGGTGNAGVVFQLVNVAGYPETILYSFCAFLGCPDGGNPYSNVIFGGSSTNPTMYGTTAYGGVWAHGTAFELVPPAYTIEAVLYNFCSVALCADGATPLAGLTMDFATNLYGTTEFGGTGFGAVFELPAPAYGPSATLYSFGGGVGDGATPWGGVIFDYAFSTTELYGATTTAGTASAGVVYSVP